ncbi:hypothetical protein AGMMS49957_07390 [Synergistales bacterium]|nr:hypothetical protein AGMMS49957_07390 [Synergistales bacterium]
MSLWEKWEREKLEAQGVKVERPRDVVIEDKPVKKNPLSQFLIVALAVVLLFALYELAQEDRIYRIKKWSGSYIGQFFAEREEGREKQAKEKR